MANQQLSNYIRTVKYRLMRLYYEHAVSSLVLVCQIGHPDFVGLPAALALASGQGLTIAFDHLKVGSPVVTLENVSGTFQFNGVQCRLTIGWDAIIAIVDPVTGIQVSEPPAQSLGRSEQGSIPAPAILAASVAAPAPASKDPSEWADPRGANVLPFRPRAVQTVPVAGPDGDGGTEDGGPAA